MTIKARNPIIIVGDKRLPILAAGSGDMTMPGVCSCPSWAVTTMINKAKHAAKMVVVTGEAIFAMPFKIIEQQCLGRYKLIGSEF